MRPWIAIVGELAVGERTEVRLSQRYAAAVERAGGLPFVVPYGSEDGQEELVARADGLLVSGGDDFDAARLGLGPTHPAARPVPRHKQDFDLALVRRALAAGLPVLGICYGMQLLGLSCGAALHQHLPEDRPGSRPHGGGVRHAVRLVEGTKLRALAGVPSLDVVSRHHQALASPGAGWAASAADEEGLIEAIERPDHPFALGVQWHPELAVDPTEERIFEALVRAARARASGRCARELAT
jgi:putative glutamine amidotransferase